MYIRVLKVETLSIGQRMKELIEEGKRDGRFSSKKDFVRKFNEWCDKKHPQFKLWDVSLSRWINNKVTPRQDVLELFAEYFEVNPDYLSLKTLDRQKRRRPRTGQQIVKEASGPFKKDHPELSEEIRKSMQLHDLIQFVKSLGYDVSFFCPDGQDATTYQTQSLENGKVYTLEVTDFRDLSDVAAFEIKYPDGRTKEATEGQLMEALEFIKEFTEFEFSRFRKDRDESKCL